MAQSPASPPPQDGYGKLGTHLLRNRSTRNTSRKESGASATSAPPITPQSLPSEVLIARFQDIKHISKALVQYFENIVESENECAKSLVKASATLNRVIPFESSFQFIPEDAEKKGLQGICFSIREKTREMSNHHINFAKSIESTAIEPLKKIRLDIKAHIKSIESEVKKLEIDAEKERETSGQAIIELNKSISLAQSQSHILTISSDPFVTNRQAYRQLKKQLKAENDLYQATVLAQQRSKTFEEDIITQFQRVWLNFENWSNQSRSSISTEWKYIREIFESLTPDQEWNHFANIPGTILDPKAPMKDWNSISYPGQNDSMVTVVKKGLLKRKKRWTKMESEGLWILTKSGFFHEVPKNDDDDDPVLSLYLPNVTLGPLFSSPTSKEHGFVLEGNKEATGGVERAMKSRIGLGAKEIEYVFLAQSHYEAEDWWKTISNHVRDVYQSREKMIQEMAATTAAAGTAAAVAGAEEGDGEAEATAASANERQQTTPSAAAVATGTSDETSQQNPNEPPKLPERKPTASSNSSTKTEPGVMEKKPALQQQVKPRSASTSSPYPAEKVDSSSHAATKQQEKEPVTSSNNSSTDRDLQMNTGNIPPENTTTAGTAASPVSDEKKEKKATVSPVQPVAGSRFAERFDME